MKDENRGFNEPRDGESEQGKSGDVIAPERPRENSGEDMRQIIENSESLDQTGEPAQNDDPNDNLEQTIESKEAESNQKESRPAEKDQSSGKKNKPKKFGTFFRRQRKVRGDEIVRIEELEAALAANKGEVDPEAIVSMYMPQRRIRRFGAILLHTDKLRFFLLCLLLGIAILFIISFMQEKMGNFTINLNRLELYRKGISIASDGNFTDATARLAANVVADATNISIDDLPKNLDEIDGDHNGKNYMAYTYYLRNAGKEDVGYIASLTLTAAAKGAHEAVRVAVWHNGERTVYAVPSADGTPEEGCENFLSETVVCQYYSSDFLVGNVDKYTIVIWMEGDDPECLDNIVGGSVEFTMNIDSDTDDESSLLWKFVKDIWDTLVGDKPIDAAGTEAPNYYNDQEITWENRRNKDKASSTSTENQAP